MHQTKRRGTDLWQVGIVHRPMGDLLTPGALAAADITWLPSQRSFAFLADPFGLWHEGELTVFVEAYDYRTKRGEIYYYRYDEAWNMTGTGVALRSPHHLSYPQIIRDGDEIYMLPEAHRSGTLTLYRAERFPDQWTPVSTLLDLPAIDASVIRHQNRWWMFFTLPGPDRRAFRELHLAYADALTGPWTLHAANPVRLAQDSARPGGAPFVHDGELYLPTQDCTHSYGDAVIMLRIDTLTTEAFEAVSVIRLGPEGLNPYYADGLHTISACGEVTLIDVKRIDHSPRRWIDLERKLRRVFGR